MLVATFREHFKESEKATLIVADPFGATVKALRKTEPVETAVVPAATSEFQPTFISLAAWWAGLTTKELQDKT